jgi:hypothetical protein
MQQVVKLLQASWDEQQEKMNPSSSVNREMHTCPAGQQRAPSPSPHVLLQQEPSIQAWPCVQHPCSPHGLLPDGQEPHRRRPVASFGPQCPSQHSPGFRQISKKLRQTSPARVSPRRTAPSVTPAIPASIVFSVRRRDTPVASERVSSSNCRPSNPSLPIHRRGKPAASSNPKRGYGNARKSAARG